MSVEIIIERRFKGAPSPEHLQVIHDLRVKAMKQTGYISGATFVNLEDQREVVVLSSWSSLDDWNRWLKDVQRGELENELSPHLGEEVKIRTFMPSADYVTEALAKFGDDA